MILENEADELFEDGSKLCQSLGFSLVDISLRKKDEKVMISAVVTGPQGFGINECAKVHRVLVPRLEVLFDKKDIYLEVSSPGLERPFKHQREFEIFQGQPLRYLMVGASEWERGFLVSAGAEVLVIKTGDGEITVKRKDVVKAKLDLLGEGHINE